MLNILDIAYYKQKIWKKTSQLGFAILVGGTQTEMTFFWARLTWKAFREIIFK